MVIKVKILNASLSGLLYTSFMDSEMLRKANLRTMEKPYLLVGN